MLIGIFILVFVLLFFFLFLKALAPSTQPLFQPDHPPIIPPLLIPACLVLIIAFNLFLYRASPPQNARLTLGLAGFLISLNLALFLILKPSKRNPFTLSLVVFNSALATAFCLRANDFLYGFNLLVIGLNTLLLAFIHLQDAINWHLLWLAKNSLRSLLKLIGHLPRLLNHSTTSNHPNFLNLLKTALITLIVFGLFSSLLRAADPVFDRLVQQYLSELLPRTGFSLLLIFAFVPLATLKLSSHPQNQFRLTRFSRYDFLVPLAALSLLLGGFLLVQARYLFASEAVFQSLNLSYSQYVRRGFTQLLLATFIGGLLVYLCLHKHRLLASTDPFKRYLKLLNHLLLFELFCLLLSALKRDLLYIDTYGLTRVRLIGGFFLVWLAGFLLLLFILNHTSRFLEKRFLSLLYTLSAVIVLSLNLINLDAIIAAATPSHHQYPDYFYLNNLSTDAFSIQKDSIPSLQASVDYLTKLTDLTPEQVAELTNLKLALISLQVQTRQLLRQYAPEDWLLTHFDQIYQLPTEPVDPDPDPKTDNQLARVQAFHLPFTFFNLADYQAYQTIIAQPTLFLDQVDQSLQTIYDYQISHQISLFTSEQRLLVDFSYPYATIKIKSFYQPQELKPYTLGSDQPPVVQQTLNHLTLLNPLSITQIKTNLPNQTTVYAVMLLPSDQTLASHPDILSRYDLYGLYDIPQNLIKLYRSQLLNQTRQDSLSVLSVVASATSTFPEIKDHSLVKVSLSRSNDPLLPANTYQITDLQLIDTPQNHYTRPSAPPLPN